MNIRAASYVNSQCILKSESVVQNKALELLDRSLARFIKSSSEVLKEKCKILKYW